MKTGYVLFLLLLSLGSAKAQSYEIEKLPDTINKIDTRNFKVGIWVIRGRHLLKPEHKKFRPEQLIETGMYVNNRKEGVWLEYHPNGKMRSKITYVNGVLDGPATFYDNAEKIIKDGTFKGNKWVN